MRFFRAAHKRHARFLGRSIGLDAVTAYATADNINPGGLPPLLSGNDVVYIQVLAVKCFITVLASVFITFKEVLPRQFDVLLRQLVKNRKQDNFGNGDPQGYRFDNLLFLSRVGGRAPFPKREGVEGVLFHVDDLGMPGIEQADGPFRAADVDGLP